MLLRDLESPDDNGLFIVGDRKNVSDFKAPTFHSRKCFRKCCVCLSYKPSRNLFAFRITSEFFSGKKGFLVNWG